MEQTRTIEQYLQYAQRRGNEQGHNSELLDDQESIETALETLASSPEWPHFHQQARITLELPYITGTVSISHLNTAVTSAGADFVTAGIDETWAIRFNGSSEEYRILEGSVTIGGFTLQDPFLSEDGTNLSAVPYILIKREYILPDNFRQLQSISKSYIIAYNPKPATLKSLLLMSKNNTTSGFPTHYTIASKDNTAKKYIRFYPYVAVLPLAAYDILYQRFPKKMNFDNFAEVVDWPDEARAVLNAAIEIEVARKNKDYEAMQASQSTLAEAMQKHLDGALEDVNTLRMGTLVHGRGRENRSIPIDVDTSGVL